MKRTPPRARRPPPRRGARHAFGDLNWTNRTGQKPLCSQRPGSRLGEEKALRAPSCPLPGSPAPLAPALTIALQVDAMSSSGARGQSFPGSPPSWWSWSQIKSTRSRGGPGLSPGGPKSARDSRDLARRFFVSELASTTACVYN